MVHGIKRRSLLTFYGILISLGAFTSTASAQNTSITGTVSDAQSGETLPGVNILVKGTSTGASTDADGQYELTVESMQDTLVVSFVGYKTQQVPINGRTEIDVALQTQAISGEEVVVVGYGTQKKENLTGSVSSIDFESEEVSSRPVNNISSALGGKISGLSVQQGQGTPSASGASLRIRGIGSLNSSQQPLVIIDGVPGDINSLNPNDVANISVLKDAASAAIYGSRASNGVILVTTKKGKNTNGKISLDYRSTVGFTKPTRLFDIVDHTANQMTLINRIETNSGLSPSFSKSRIQEWRQKSKTNPVKYPNTNWWDAILKNNVIQTHDISAQGGSETLSFFSSFRYHNNDGLIDKTSYNKYNFRADINYNVKKWLKLEANISGLKSEAGPASTDNIFRFFNASTPAITPIGPDGRYGAAMSGGGESQANNNVKHIKTNRGEDNTQRYKGKFSGVLTPVKGLTIKASYFLNTYNSDGWHSNEPVSTWNFQNNSIVKSAEGAVLGLSNNYTKQINRIINANATYSKGFKKNNFKILAGYNQEYFKTQSFNAYGKDLLSLSTPVLDATSTNPQVGGNASDYARRSFFGRLNYNYDQKYLFEANIRTDGSSRFAPGHRWGVFPSFSVGWVISAEPFWSNFKSIFNHFKIRGSWGKLGNNGIGNYRWQSVYNPNNYSFNSKAVPGLAPNAIANRKISWENTKQYNVGLDFSLLNNNLSFTFDYYNKLAENILAQPPIPYVNGGLTPPTTNSAQVRNTGVNGDVSYSKQFGDWSFSVSANGSYNKNRIEKYKEGVIEPHGTAQVWTEGQPIGVFRIRKVDHIVQSQSEVDKLQNNGWEFSPSKPGAGDFLYEDINGDKKVNDDDRTLTGHPIPKYNFGGSINLSYKGFNLYVTVAGVAGWDKYLHGGFFTTQPRTDGYLYPKKFLNSWTKENKSTTVPKLYTNSNKNDVPSDHFLYNSSYLRFKTIQFGYNLPVNLIERAGIDKIRLYIDLENYFTLTPYPGMDPETSGSYYQGNITYPLMKTLNFGLNIKI